MLSFASDYTEGAHPQVLRRLVQERMFERYIVMDSRGGVGHVSQIYDSRGSQLYRSERKAVC